MELYLYAKAIKTVICATQKSQLFDEILLPDDRKDPKFISWKKECIKSSDSFVCALLASAIFSY